MKFNGVDLADRYASSAGGYFIVNDVRGRGVIGSEVDMIDVPGRDGSYVVGKRRPPRALEVDITLKGDSYEDLRKKIEDLNALLSTETDAEIVFDDEPDRVYYGRLTEVNDKLEKSKIYQATLTFICPDPYKYGPLRTQTINDPGGEGNPIVNNEGTAETYPTFTAYVKQPITFLDIIAPDAYMRVGQPYEVSQTPVDGEKPVMKDEMGTLTGWGTASVVDGGVIQGEFQTDGNRFTVKNFGPTYNGWAGPALKKSLPYPIQDFRVHALIDIVSSANGVGRIEIYGLDAANNFVFRMAVGDFSAKAKNVKAFWELGPSTDTIFVTYGKKTGSLNDYYGSLVIERKGNRWYFCTAKRTSQLGVYTDFVEKTFIDTKNQYTAPLTQIQVHIGTHLGYGPIDHMSINHVYVYDLHNPATDQIPYIAYPDDILQFDHKNAVIYRNGEPIMAYKDFGARFFPLAPGETELAVNPSDAAIVTAEYRPRYK